MREIACSHCGEPTPVEVFEDGQPDLCQNCGQLVLVAHEAVPSEAESGSPEETLDFSDLAADDIVFGSEKKRAPLICPMCGTSNARKTAACSACGEPLARRRKRKVVVATTSIRSQSRVFEEAWAIFKRSKAVVMGAMLVVAFLTAGLCTVAAGAAWLGWGGLSPLLWIVVCAPVLLVWGLYWQLGLCRLALNVCRNESPALSDVLMGGPRCLQAIAAMIGIWMAYGLIPMSILILPTRNIAELNFIVILMLGIFVLAFPVVLAMQLGVGFALMDRSQPGGVMKSLRITFDMIDGNFLSLYVLIPCGAAALAAAGTALVFPLIVVAPYLLIVCAIAYLRASGQSATIVLPSEGMQRVEGTSGEFG